MKRERFFSPWRFILSAGVFLSALAMSVSLGWTEDYSVFSNDPAALENSAKYNYYVGQYYYSQERYTDAEAYFQTSRDMMERRQDLLSKEGQGSSLAGAAAASGSVLEYKVGYGDVIYITVWENPDLNQETIVRPDGKISFPLIGDVMAVGRTLSDIDADLTSRLKEFIRFPEVSLVIRKIGGSKVILLGQVGRPGVYAVSGDRTILEAVALAGGFTQDAVTNSVVLIRGGFQNPQAQRLNLKDVVKGSDLRDNIALESEDIIFVPKTFISNLGYFLMQIIDPISRGAFTADVMMNMV